MLGVRPDASHDLVKRAYATLALRWHPDRQQDRTPEALRLAEFHMAEVNAAWEVLRNPASRAAYDRSLRGEPSGRSPSSPAAPVHAGAAVLVPDLGARRAASSGLPLGCVWLLASIGVLVVIAVVALVVGDDDPADLDVRTREPLGIGACVVTDRSGVYVAVAEVPCDAPHDGVVAERTIFPKGCSVGLTAVLLDDQRTVVCLRSQPTPSGTLP